jgi:IS1 transposase
VLELDEIWSFVQKKEQKRWVWTAMCRRTRQIVAFVIGDRSKATCHQLWQAIPQEYNHCHTDHVIFGMLINTFSRLKPIIVLERKLGRPRIWNGGTTPYANGLGATCDRHYLFPSPMSIIIWSPSGLLFSIIVI